MALCSLLQPKGAQCVTFALGSQKFFYLDSYDSCGSVPFR